MLNQKKDNLVFGFLKTEYPFKMSGKGPRTLHTKLQKMQLSSIHTTTFCHNCNDFFNSFIYGQRFSRLFEKNLCSFVCRCKGPNFGKWNWTEVTNTMFFLPFGYRWMLIRLSCGFQAECLSKAAVHHKAYSYFPKILCNSVLCLNILREQNSSHNGKDPAALE